MIFKKISSCSTAGCNQQYSSGYENKIRLGIIESIIKHDLHNVDLGIQPINDVNFIFLTGRYPSELNIPLYHDPVTVEHKNKTYIVTDVRQFVKPIEDSDRNEVSIKNNSLFLFHKHRAIFTALWESGYQSNLNFAFPFISDLYTIWITEVLSKRYALDPKEQVIVRIVVYCFYQSLFENTAIVEYNEQSIDDIAILISKSYRIPSELIYEVLKKVKMESNIKGLCQCIGNCLENERFKEFNTGILLSMLSTTYYGLYANYYISVALEHPPTLLSIFYSAVTDRSNKNSLLAKTANRLKATSLENFIKGVDLKISEYTQ